MSRKESGFTELAVPGEPYHKSIARFQTWMLAQMTPEQFRLYAQSVWGISLSEGFQIIPSKEWAATAVIPLVDNVYGLLAGVRLDHPNLQGNSQWVRWHSQRISLKVEMIAGDHLRFTTGSSPQRFGLYERKLDIFATNIHQEAEYATTAQLDLRAKSHTTLAMPSLVEDIPSILLRLSTDRQKFIESTFSPIGHNLRQSIEKILSAQNF